MSLFDSSTAWDIPDTSLSLDSINPYSGYNAPVSYDSPATATIVAPDTVTGSSPLDAFSKLFNPLATLGMGIFSGIQQADAAKAAAELANKQTEAAIQAQREDTAWKRSVQAWQLGMNRPIVSAGTLSTNVMPIAILGIGAFVLYKFVSKKA